MGISRLLGISKNTVTKRILQISDDTGPPQARQGAVYEIDEMWSFAGNKDNDAWIAYALDKKTKEVVALSVGPSRSKALLRPITKTLLKARAKRIYTDGLNSYPSLIPKGVHEVRDKGTSRIERMNLNLRTHIKRLNRKTICYSKSMAMLLACLKIYFWG